MYYPYFRGKQYELITIRENAELLKNAGFVPIIEPVKESMNGLIRALTGVKTVGGECILIINPIYGDYYRDGKAIMSIFEDDQVDFPALSVGILLTSSMSIDNVMSLCKEHSTRRVTLIHCGFKEGRELAEILKEYTNVERHIFIEDVCGKLYRKHFDGLTRILLRDGFQKRINREHPPLELFSDLHATFKEEGMDGFGDFLTVGDDFAVSGGPAYAVAIHLTLIDKQGDGEMYIHHFVSDRTDTPSDPAGKFEEALDKLVAEVGNKDSQILHSKAVEEYISLHNPIHYPGLGYVKKLSMQHHIETLADYFNPETTRS